MLFKLAYRELTWDRIMSICQVAAIASIIAPLLLLFSLRYGILEELRENLMNDPKVLSLTLDTSYRLDSAFFNKLKSNPNVGYIIPEVTALNALVDIKFPGGVKRAEVIPTSPGDPVVLGSDIAYSSDSDALADHETFINESFALQRNLKPGDTITAVISRTREGMRQSARIELTVKGIIKQRFVDKDSIMVNLDVVNAIDDYRNGYDPALLTDGNYVREKDRIYAKFRLYARDLAAVTPLYYSLVERHLNVTSKIREIENVNAISRVLNFVFGVVALVSVTGGAIALGGLIFSSLKSRRRNLVLLRLMGQTRSDIYLLATIEAVIISLVGFVLAYFLYSIGSGIFNDYFHNLMMGPVISRLTVLHIVSFLGATVGIASAIALLSTHYVFLKVQIADILREA